MKAANALNELTWEKVARFDEQATNGEAWSYCENSQVRDATVYQNHLYGRVGNFVEEFQVQIAVSDQEISSSCTCSSSRDTCIHVIALLYTWVSDSEDFIHVDRVIEQLKSFSKDELVSTIARILRNYPQLSETVLEKDLKDWDEIDRDPKNEF